jgi:hypothetical protein
MNGPADESMLGASPTEVGGDGMSAASKLQRNHTRLIPGASAEGSSRIIMPSQ